MADVVSPEIRSRMMAGIRSKHTKPEKFLRSALHARGFRYRLHGRQIAGKPDLVFPKYQAVVFVHGCFWHGHDCAVFKWPKTRAEWWRVKIEGNRKRDRAKILMLREAGWRTGVVWECAVRATPKCMDAPLEVANWLQGSDETLEVSA